LVVVNCVLFLLQKYEKNSLSPNKPCILKIFISPGKPQKMKELQKSEIKMKKSLFIQIFCVPLSRKQKKK